MKLTKDTLANFVEDLVKLMSKNIDICKSAAGKIDDLKTAEIKTQKKMLELQEKQLQSVQATVKTEMQSWSDVVKKNCQSGIPSAKTVKKVVREVVEEDTRSKNLIIYSAHDWVTEDLSPVIDGVFNKIGLYPPPEHLSACRIGPYKDNDGSPRPIKVTLECSESVKLALSKAHIN